MRRGSALEMIEPAAIVSPLASTTPLAPVVLDGDAGYWDASPDLGLPRRAPPPPAQP